MDLQPFKIPETEAREQWLAYRDAFRKSRAEEDEALMKGYREVAKGNTVIALSTVMQHAGLNEKGYPRLAIARADTTQVAVQFAHIPSDYRPCACVFYDPAKPRLKATNLVIAEGVFPAFEGEAKFPGELRRDKRTIVPSIPPRFRPPFKLCNYHILWEVDAWRPVASRDPALLKDLGAGLYAVLAVWDLTPLEQAVLGMTRGKLPR